MLTPQEVSSRSFTKAVMGGYNMTMVDEFLDQLTDDYTSLYKENASLKAKLKVLLEKVEEYRKTEDGMRSTLLAAQNLAAQITADAEKQRDEILRGAEQAAAEKIAGIEQEVADNEARLEKSRSDLAHFVSACREICNKELELLDNLPTVYAAPAAEKTDETEESARAIEENLRSAMASDESTEAFEAEIAAQSEAEAAPDSAEPTAVLPDLSAAAPAAEPAPAAPAPAPAVEAAPAPAAETVEEPTRRLRDFGELKFGKDYRPGK